MSFSLYLTAQDTLETLNHGSLMAAEDNMWRWESEYRRSKGWFFSCDKICNENWEMYRMAEAEYVAGDGRRLFTAKL